jgi:O-Antigen ligase
MLLKMWPNSPLDRSNAILLSACALIAIWPLPGTMALRNLLLIAGLFLSISVLSRLKATLFQKDAWPIWCTSSFFLWLLIHYAFFAHRPEEQLAELKGVWVRAAISAIIGLATGLTLLERKEGAPNSHKPTQWFMTIGLSATTVIYAIGYFVFCATRKTWITPPFFAEIYGGKPPIVVFVGLASVLYFINAYESLMKRSKRELFVWGALIATSLFDFIFTGTKNGVIVFILVLGIATAAAFKSKLRGQQRKVLVLATTCLIAFTLPVVTYHIRANEAWKNILPDIQTAWDIDSNQEWKQVGNYDLPSNQNQQLVNRSTYERIAWAHVGLTLIEQNPLGYGLLHHSFGAMAAERWSDFHKPDGITRGATHSAWIDMTLGIGIPGVSLIAFGLAISLARSYRLSGFWRRYVASTIPLLVFIYLITEVASDVYVEFLFYLIFLFLGMTLQKRVGKLNFN